MVVASPALAFFYLGTPIVYRYNGASYEPIGSALTEDVGTSAAAINDVSLLVGSANDRFYNTGYAVGYSLPPMN